MRFFCTPSGFILSFNILMKQSRSDRVWVCLSPTACRNSCTITFWEIILGSSMRVCCFRWYPIMEAERLDGFTIIRCPRLTSSNWRQESKTAVRFFNALLTAVLWTASVVFANSYLTNPLGQRYLLLFFVTLPFLPEHPATELMWLFLCSLFRIISPSKRNFW